MSEIDSIISDIRSESGSSIRSFDKLFNDTQDDVDDILNNNLLDNDEIEAIPSSHINSQRSSTQTYRSSNSSQSHPKSSSKHQSRMAPHHTYRSANSCRTSNSSISTNVSDLTHENLMKKQKEEMETEKHKSRYSKSVHGSVKSFKSTTDYSSLDTYKNSQKRKVKTQHPLDLTGSPNEVIERIDNMVKCICDEHDINIRSSLAEKHRDTILIQVFLNTMNSNRKDIARACKYSMSKSSQKKTPCIA